MAKKIRKPGVYNISNSEYHGDLDYFSSSILKEALESPAHFKYYILQKNKEPVDNKAFALGTLVHTVLLEPHLFDEQYIIYTGKTNKDGTIPAAELKKLSDKHGDKKEFISDEWYKFAVKSREHTLNYPDAAKFVFSETGVSEPSYFTLCKETGLRLKVRPDRLDLTNKFICDPKTSMVVDKYSFGKVVKYDRHYDLSAYMYVKQIYEWTDVHCDFYWHVVGKEPMCPIAIYKASHKTLEEGKAKFFRACDNIKAALAMPDVIRYQNELEEI